MSAHTRKPSRDAGEELPSLDKAMGRLAARRDELLPWLTPEGLAALADLAAQGVPEINGPEIMHLPDED